jgi:hypothetical protein
MDYRWEAKVTDFDKLNPFSRGLLLSTVVSCNSLFGILPAPAKSSSRSAHLRHNRITVPGAIE